MSEESIPRIPERTEEPPRTATNHYPVWVWDGARGHPTICVDAITDMSDAEYEKWAPTVELFSRQYGKYGLASARGRATAEDWLEKHIEGVKATGTEG